jgi:hypothetical protein
MNWRCNCDKSERPRVSLLLPLPDVGRPCLAADRVAVAAEDCNESDVIDTDEPNAESGTPATVYSALRRLAVAIRGKTPLSALVEEVDPASIAGNDNWEPPYNRCTTGAARCARL